MRLNLLRPGQAGRITEVNCDGQVGQRLMEMGLFEGADVKVMRIAPLGDPMEVEVQGYRLSLRKVEAERVEVTETTVTAAPAAASASKVPAIPEKRVSGRSRKKPA